MMRRRHLASVALVLASVGLTGCTASRSGGQDAADAATQAQATYENIIDTLHGTAADRIAEEARVSNGFQNAIAACMSKAGFSYQPVPPLGFAGGPITLADWTELAPIGRPDFAMADMLQRVAASAEKIGNPGYDNLTTGARRRAYFNATKGCFAVPTPAEFRPTGATDLEKRLLRIFKPLRERPQTQAALAGYGPCMRARGFTAGDYTQLHQLVREQFPDTSVGWTALRTSKRWAAAVDFEHRAAAATTACRIGLYNQVMAAAAAPLRDFAATNADALARIDTEWALRRGTSGPHTTAAPAGRAPGNPVPDMNAASCAESYSPARVAERAFAFDGTITTIGPGRTRKRPATGVSSRRAVTFHVNVWFTGGTDDTAVVDMTQPTLLPSQQERMLPTYAVGTRLLVTGEPDSPGPTMHEAVAWGCGFTHYYSPDTASQWAKAAR
jgi:predicted small secreted protein